MNVWVWRCSHWNHFNLVFDVHTATIIDRYTEEKLQYANKNNFRHTVVECECTICCRRFEPRFVTELVPWLHIVYVYATTNERNKITPNNTPTRERERIECRLKKKTWNWQACELWRAVCARFFRYRFLLVALCSLTVFPFYFQLCLICYCSHFSLSPHCMCVCVCVWVSRSLTLGVSVQGKKTHQWLNNNKIKMPCRFCSVFSAFSTLLLC